MDDFEAMEPEFHAKNTIRCTTFGFGRRVFTVSTVKLSSAPHYGWCRLVTLLSDIENNTTHLSHMDYETLLFVDGEPGEYPFGSLSGNEEQGVFQRYNTVTEAIIGHEAFIAKVKETLKTMIIIDAVLP